MSDRQPIISNEITGQPVQPPSVGYQPQPQGFQPQPQGFQQGYQSTPGGQGPVVQVPAGAQIQWMAPPEPIPGVPPGLEYLAQIDQLLVHQQVELFEVLTGWETINRYQIKNSLGQQVYFAHEESDMCMRQCCGGARGFAMHITNNYQQEVIRIQREFKCCAGCCWCACTDHCAFELAVEAPVGQIVGYVRQMQSAWKACYSLLNAQRECIMKIQGPCCVCSGVCCTFDQNFRLYSEDMVHELGSVTKQYSGFFKEAYTKATNFSVTFPLDLDAKMKAVALAATFLIDFSFYEQKKNQNHHHHH